MHETELTYDDARIAGLRQYTLRLDLERLPIIQQLGEAVDGDALLWAAVYYARAGMPVFPLMPGTKIPYPKTNGVDDATTDLRRVRAWWTRNPDDNVGIACGYRFDTLDIDVKDGAPGMESLEKLRRAGLLRGVWADAATPSGGLHLLFAASPGATNHVRKPLGVDYKTRGGYIVAAPSTTKDGAYQWETSEPDRMGPTFDWEAAMDVLGQRKPAPLRTFTGDTKSADGLIRTVAEAQQGERNPKLYWSACRAIENGIDPEILREAARSVGLSEREISSTLASAARGVAA
jgi:hypothetical protein